MGATAEVLAEFLRKNGYHAAVVPDLETLCHEIPLGAACVILLQEALADIEAEMLLASTLKKQPGWSDLAVYVLIDGGVDPAIALSRFSEAGYDRAMLLSRPLKEQVLLSLLRGAFRSRSRQYLMKNLIEDLRAGERTASGFNEELQHTVQMGVHDMGQPLSAASLLLRVLKNELQDRARQDLKEMLENLEAAVTSAADFNRDLLQYLRGFTGTVEVAVKPVDLMEIVATVAPGYRGEVTWSGLPKVLGNKLLLTRLLRNLIDNGLKYNRSSTPRVHLSAERLNSLFRIDVRDNGIGIPDEDKERVFQLFSRGHTEGFHGSGIGLASCRQIVTRLGGEIWVRDAEGGGSVFSFTLQAAAA